MYIDIVPNRSSPPAVLLRESTREGDRIVKHTLANLSALSQQQVAALRAILRGDALVSPAEAFDKVRDREHGGCEAVRVAMRRLGFDALLDSRRSRQRDLVVAMVTARILEPRTKLAMARTWSAWTLPGDPGIGGAGEDDLYAAMDWLGERQQRIEKRLAARHLKDGGLALYDLSSSYFEGTTCPLAALGHNRDGKRGLLQVNYGLTTDDRGCPVAVSVYDGNTADSKTLLPAVAKLREDFGLSDVVLVGDRGMISQKQIDKLRDMEGVAWITALRSTSIRKLIDGGALQLGLLDQKNLFEFVHDDYPGERLVACRNPELAVHRAHKREALLAATEKALGKVAASVHKGRLRGAAHIGLRVGKVIERYKVAKHFVLDIREDSFSFSRDAQRIAEEAALDGIYVIRTALSAASTDSADVVRHYRKLARVERAFRSIKTVDLKVRPIHHRLEGRVRSHIFLCMLAYYVEWHMIEALRPMTFADEIPQEERAQRDPVAPARRSASALRKVKTKKLPDGSPVHSFKTLLADLRTIVRSTCRARGAPAAAPTFELATTPTPTQCQAFDLLAAIAAYPVS